MIKRILSIQAHPDTKLRERNTLRLVGIARMRETLMGLTGGVESAYAARWLGKPERPEAGAE